MAPIDARFRDLGYRTYVFIRPGSSFYTVNTGVLHEGGEGWSLFLGRALSFVVLFYILRSNDHYRRSKWHPWYY